MPAVSRVNVEFVDHSDERTSSKFWVEALTDANFDTLFDPVTGKVSLIQGAMVVASQCAHAKTNLSYTSDTSAGTPPAGVHAQREIAIRIGFRDTVNSRTGHWTVPGPIDALYPPTGVKGDIVALDNAALVILLAVLTANALSEDGNAVTVYEARLVGRNN